MSVRFSWLSVVQFFYFLVDLSIIVLLIYLSMIVSGALKSPTVIIEQFLPSVLSVCFMYLRTVRCLLLLGAYIYNCYIFLKDQLIYHYESNVPLFPLTIFVLKSILSGISIAILALCLLSFVWYIFLQNSGN